MDVSKAATQFEDLLRRKEELDEELVPFVDETDHFTVLKHPLVFGVPYTPAMNAYYNESLRHKMKAIEEAEKDKDWNRYIFMHERPYRIEAFWAIKNKMTDKEYWENVGDIWTDSENLWQMVPYLRPLLNSPRAGKEEMMDEEEKKLFDSLPPKFIIYRGHHLENQHGFSWTLSYMIGYWFGHRFADTRHKAHVSMAICNKQDVHAVLLGRREFEIVVDPDKLKKIGPVKKVRRTNFIESVFKEAYADFALKSSRSYHGLIHWEKVEINAINLCKKVKDADKLVCQIFALVHDCKRVEEDEDPEHGHRAAEWVTQNKLLAAKLSVDQMNKLIHACRYHNDGQTTDDPTIGVCWDADRLDLPRVGIIPDPERLSTYAAKSMIWSV